MNSRRSSALVVPLLLAGLAAAVLAAAAAAPDLLPRGAGHRVEDFGLYWSAARVSLTGGNPYDPAALWPHQQAIEPNRAEPQLPWGPPWSLGLLEPFAAVDFGGARWAWLFFGLALVLASATVAWELYGGSPDRVAWAWLVAVTFYPTLLVTALGQQTVFALAGVAGFLWANDRRRPALAGACLALTLAKPQNLILLWLAVGIISLVGRQWRLLGGLAAGCGALSIVALIPNPAVFQQYRYAMTYYPPQGWATPTVGTYLRMGLGVHEMGPAFLVTAAGGAWVVWYLFAHRHDWDWRRHTPVLLFASYLTSPYGWAYDQVVLLIPVLHAAAVVDQRGAKSRAVFLTGHLVLTALCVVLNRMKTPEYTFVWLAPVLLLGWWFVCRGTSHAGRAGAAAP